MRKLARFDFTNVSVFVGLGERIMSPNLCTAIEAAPRHLDYSPEISESSMDACCQLCL
jgi:hypothetical protein